ncbi:MAG: DUF4215 domain-containing protein [Deltaproteobacteria bacterium]|nr:DUF4215 domain-containing protein [Deltaproteobacteria bacterium]
MKRLAKLGPALLVALLTAGGLGCPGGDPALEPVVMSFTATPSSISAGESSTLAWVTQNTVSLRLVDDAGNTIDVSAAGVESGSVEVSPGATTEYALTATGGEDTTPVTARLTITVAPADVCGNGTVSGSEACDDGNTADGDYCSAACDAVTGRCGDGSQQTNEACDDGNTVDGDYCSADCAAATGACGDGTLQTNEACDDGNTADGDYCSADCLTANGACGDGTLETFEACDDGNTADGDYCSADCMTVDGACGDGAQQANEVCDDGNTAAGDYCSADCQSVDGACGDGTTQINETCDDGNTADGDYCAADCQSVTGACGDGTQQTNEACDDGNTLAGDYCDYDCQTVTGSCGDTFVQGNEVCDDGNTTDGDGCRADCLGREECGDTLLDLGEACDDGNTTEGDGCRADCLGLEQCGDGLLDLDEECDDGNNTDADGCSALCTHEGGSCALAYPLATSGATGNGTFRWSASTAGFTASLDAPCATTGQNPEAFAEFTAPAAGDYYILAYTPGWDAVMWIWDAVCDAASTSLACVDTVFGAGGEDTTLTLASGQTIFIVLDGWGDGTTNEGAFDLFVAPQICGDGLVINTEACDDGNATAGDGCSDTCALEPGYTCPAAGQACRLIQCGDSFIDGSETCDDGNATAGDGCSDLCVREAGYACPAAGSACRQIVCGDGFADPPEACDDGNTAAGDGCGASCMWEGGSCADPYDLTALGARADGSFTWSKDTSLFAADYNASCTNSGANGDAVARFVAPAAGDYLIRVVATEFDPVLWVWDAVCDPATADEVFCRDQGAGDELSVEALAANQTLYIVVDGYGNSTSNEGQFTLTVAPVVCGDSVITAGAERCDDGNATAGDGCSDSCEVESGWDCPAVGSACTFVCGNGTIDASEVCDDGNFAGGDGCAADCGAVAQGWDCPVVGADCVFTCGSGTLEGNETCDDGNNTSLDGCTDLCLLEGGFDCSGTPTTCTSWSLPTAAGDLVITEVMRDPLLVIDRLGEWFELHNPTGTDLQLLGVKVGDETNAWESYTFTEPFGLPAGGYLVFGSEPDLNANGGVAVDVVYEPYDFNAQKGIDLGNGTDGLRVTDAGGALLDVVIWDGGTSFPNQTGASMALLRGMDATQNDAGGVWCAGSTPYGDGDLGSPGVANPLSDCTLTTLLSESFDTWPLTGWTLQDGSADGHTWGQCSGRVLNNSTNAFACVDSDLAGGGVTLSEGLVSPAFDASSHAFVALTFVQYYNDYNAADSGHVEVSVNGGASWTTVETYSSVDSINGETATIDLSSIAAGQPSVQVRFRYEDGGTWCWYWLIDTVTVVAL